MMKLSTTLVSTLCVLLLTSAAYAQDEERPRGVAQADPVDHQPSSSPPPLSAIAYRPITVGERGNWIVGSTVGPFSLGLGVTAATITTAWDTPREWGRSWDGFGKRYMEREADVAISVAMEAGFGAIWGEEPRYIPSGRRGIWPRARYAMKTVFLAQRRDGHLAPAWGRYLGNTLNNVVENAWLPPSMTTVGGTLSRTGLGFLGRLGGNLWEEFGPDAMRALARRRAAKPK